MTGALCLGLLGIMIYAALASIGGAGRIIIKVYKSKKDKEN